MVGTLYTARNQEYTAMQLAIDGPCKGHECDSCWYCRSGYCCRRDRPDYVLPKEGDWDGPIYGQIGVLRTDGDKAECHACGLWFRSVGQHAIHKHNLDAAQYKSIFGLNASTSLQGESLIESNRQRTLDLIAAGRIETIDKHPEWHLTPEQRSALYTGTTKRAQERRLRHSEEYRRKQSEVVARAKDGKRPLACTICGTVTMQYKSQNPRTCGSAECKSEMYRRSNKDKWKLRKKCNAPVST